MSNADKIDLNCNGFLLDSFVKNFPNIKRKFDLEQKNLNSGLKAKDKFMMTWVNDLNCVCKLGSKPLQSNQETVFELN